MSNSLLDNHTRFDRNGLSRNRSHLASAFDEGFSPSPVSPHPQPWDRTHGLLLPTWEGITRKSLPRTGRATLMASSSTGEQHQGSKRPSAGWLLPHSLGRLAPALPGTLHPISTTPSHVFRAGFRARVPYSQRGYK